MEIKIVLGTDMILKEIEKKNIIFLTTYLTIIYLFSVLVYQY